MTDLLNGTDRVPEILCGLYITPDYDYVPDLWEWVTASEADGFSAVGFGSAEPRITTLDGLTGIEQVRNVYACLSAVAGGNTLNFVIDRSNFRTKTVAPFRAAWIGADGEPDGAHGYVHLVTSEWRRNFPENFREEVVPAPYRL